MKKIILAGVIFLSSLTAQADICLSLPHNLYLIDLELRGEINQADSKSVEASEAFARGELVTCEDYEKALALNKNRVNLVVEFLNTLKVIENERCSESAEYRELAPEIELSGEISANIIGKINDSANASGCSK